MTREKSNRKTEFIKNCGNLHPPEELIHADCLIPAAGLSSRMGFWKPGGAVAGKETLLERAVRTALSVCTRVIVVGGYRYEDLLSLLPRDDRIFPVENRLYEKGMLSSIQAGLSAVEQDFFVYPPDMPLIEASHFRSVWEYRDSCRPVRPVFQGKPGHPIFFPALWKERILKFRGERLQGALREGEVVEIQWEDDSVLFDLDTRESWELWAGKDL